MAEIRNPYFNFRWLLIVAILGFYINSGAQTQKQFLKAGYESFESGNYFEAIYLFEQAQKFKHDDETQYHIGLSFFELKEYQKASGAFKKVKNTEKLPYTDFYLGQSEKILGNYLKAIDFFQNFINNYRIDDFFQKKATQEIASCYWALDQKEQKDIEIKHFPKPVNTPYSDFAATYFSDEKLQVTSLTPEDPKNVQSNFTAGIYFYEATEKGWKKSTVKAPGLENYSHIANGYYLAEKKEFYFTGCNNVGKKIKCDIWVAKYDGKEFKNIVSLNINDSIFTSTQPMVYVDFDGKTKIFFASNRDNLFNHTDIFTAQEISYGNFSTPQKLPSQINSIDNESTPFFDKETQKIYFSSEWHYGFGGADIFASELINNQWTKPVNLGAPINSSAHDQYYYLGTDDASFFSSNRDGSMQLKGAACCFDVFEAIKVIKEGDSSLIALNDKNQDKTTTNTDNSLNIPGKLSEIDLLRSMLPAVVYFHNDEPEPKTTLTKTKLTYEDSYNSFMSVKNDYFLNYPDSKSLDLFFNEKLEKGFNDLKVFANQLLNILEKGNKIELTFEGYCSPLALNDYNINLAKRRIVNVQNYMLSWNSDALRPYFNQGFLKFSNEPFGEEKAPEGISDSIDDLQQSIYSPKASAERRVGIIAVEIVK